MTDVRELIERLEKAGDERWLKIDGFPDYEVSDLGRVRSLKRGQIRILRPWQPADKSIYPSVSLSMGNQITQRTVHTLVLRAFVGPPPTPAHEVRHLDGDHLNPSLSNLAWGTRSENAFDRVRHGTQPKGSGSSGTKNPMAKINDETVRAIRLLADLMSQRDIARAFGIHQVAVWRIIHRKAWSHLP